MGAFDDLPTLADVQADRIGKSFPKGKTRLEESIAQRPLTKVDEKAFRLAVWKRDLDRCRVCGKKVQKAIARVPLRGEVHHLHGRVGDLRFDDRAAILVCLRDHERLTGKVNAHRLAVFGTHHFTTPQGTFINARFPITFKEIA